MSREIYDRLLVQREDLEQRGRREVAEAIRHARDFGDISENAEYQAALDEQAHLEARIQRIRERLEGAVVVEVSASSDDVVRVASLVVVEDENGERLELRLATPDPDAHVASLDSPFGRAVLGARVGDLLEIRAPRRTWHARVVAVGA